LLKFISSKKSQNIQKKKKIKLKLKRSTKQRQRQNMSLKTAASRLVKVLSPAIQKFGDREPVAASAAEQGEDNGSSLAKLGQEMSRQRGTICCSYELMWFDDSCKTLHF
jgi:hypothetical protein